MRRYLLILLLFASFKGYSQDLSYARQTLNKLTAKDFWGRGYTKNGMQKAADFIESEFKSFGLRPINGGEFKQHFSYTVNTFPGKMDLTINGEKLIPGRDFIVAQNSIGVKAKDNLEQKDSLNFLTESNRTLITLQDKLTWSVSQKVNDYTQVFVKKSSLTETPHTININIENTFLPDFKAANVAAWIKGTAQPDSVIVITAHYDHLGGMGGGGLISQAQTIMPAGSHFY